MREMMRRQAKPGRVVWIGLRPERRADLLAVEAAEMDEAGLVGDHARSGKRAVTLLQAEHLAVIGGFLGRAVAADLVRRNIVVAGANLAAFRKAEIRIGTGVLYVEGPCPPCSRMEEVLGHGGYSAVRGHGGYYASVVSPGRIALGDQVGFGEERR